MEPGKRKQFGKYSISRTNTTDFEAEVTAVIPDPPPNLKLVGQSRWYQIIDIMIGQGRWSLDWIPALEHMCQVWDQLALMDVELKKFEQMILWTENGVPRVNPLIQERHRLYSFLQTQLNCFGLTPIAAKGVYLPAVKKPTQQQKRLEQKQVVFDEE